MPAKPMLSTCCGAKLKWIQRMPKRSRLVDINTPNQRIVKEGGELVRAYACTKCGKPDRPVAQQPKPAQEVKITKGEDILECD